jgi:FkbM family methyltransferase
MARPGEAESELVNTWFIDCGAHRGESIDLARKLYGGDLSVIAVEPLAACWRSLASRGALVVPAALWTEIGMASLYRGDHEVSSTLLVDKSTGGVSRERSDTVATVTLATLLSALPDGNRVILKLDIEGAEYDVLEQAIAEKRLRWIHELFVDFHADRIPSIGKERHNALVDRLLGMRFPLQKWSPVDGGINECGKAWLL